MSVVNKINQILKEANISKVNLSKYLGVSRQMVYNYMDSDDLSKFPKEKCKLLFDLLGVSSKEDIIKKEITNEYIREVSNKIFSDKSGSSGKSSKETFTIDLSGIKKEEANLINDISIMLKNILTEGKGRSEENSALVEYVYNFIQNLNTNKELKYVLAFFSKNFGYTAPNKYVFDENNQFIFESIMFSAVTLYGNGGASRSKLAESHRRWEEVLAAKKEEKLSRTQELNTAKLRALRELGYDKIDEKNASEVLDKIAEIMSAKF